MPDYTFEILDKEGKKLVLLESPEFHSNKRYQEGQSLFLPFGEKDGQEIEFTVHQVSDRVTRTPGGIVGSRFSDTTPTKLTLVPRHQHTGLIRHLQDLDKLFKKKK